MKKFDYYVIIDTKSAISTPEQVIKSQADHWFQDLDTAKDSLKWHMFTAPELVKITIEVIPNKGKI